MLQCGSAGETCGNTCLTHKSVYMKVQGEDAPTSWAPCQATTVGPVPADNVFYPGESVDASFTLVANHGGAVKFFVCPDGSDSLECFRKHPVHIEERGSPKTDGTWGKATGGGCCTNPQKTPVRITMPNDINCTKCTLLWEWHNTKQKSVPGDVNGAAACGEGSVFHNCADISILAPPAPPPDVPPAPSPYPPYVPSPPYTPAPPPPPPPASNPWNLMAWPNGDAMCMDVAGGQLVNGATVQIWNCNGLASQQWRFENWMIKLKDQEKCLDVPGGNIQAGQRLQIWDCNGMAAQQWGYDTDSRSVYASASESDASLCLDIEGGSSTPGTSVWIWNCDHQLSQQQWYVPPSFGSFNIQNLMQGSFLCLDLLGQYTFNGNAVGAWECNGFEGQSWVFETETGNIKWAKDQSKCVDVPGGNYKAGQELWIWDCNGGDSQKFGYDADMKTVYASASADANMCIDVPRDEKAGASVWLWDCNGQSQQTWEVPNSYAWVARDQQV